MSTAEDERRARLTKLACIEEEPDTSDIPEASPDVWANAELARFYRPKKEAVTIRIDADVLAYFRQQAGGRGYQTAINAVLRRYVTGGRG